MNNSEDENANNEELETLDDDYEPNLQEELEQFINYESDFDDDDDNEDDSLVIGENCILYDSDPEDLDHEPNIQHLSDSNIASLFTYGNKNVLHLSQEEEEVISGCTNPTLKRCLVQNRLKMSQLKEIYTKLVMLQNSFRNIITKEQEKLSHIKTNSLVSFPPKTHISKLGIPYFKDQHHFASPPNVDYSNKLHNNEYMMTNFGEGRRWVDEDQVLLRHGVENSYYMYYVFHLEQQIKDIERKRKVSYDSSVKQKLENERNCLQKELDELMQGSSSKTPPYNSDVGIDWFKVANVDLKGQHSINECKAMWNIYLHPQITKKIWTSEENEKIKELAETYQFQDWDAVATELGTNRSGYMVCVNYFSNLCDKFIRDRFSQIEDEFLLEVVENCRLGSYIPWGTVARYFEDRSKHQLYHRYRYYLACKDNVKKGTFTEEEDILLVYLVQEFGKDFSKCAEYMPQRTAIQIRNRFSNYLAKMTLNLGNYSLADDQKILQYVEIHGNKHWSLLAAQMNRTRAHVRQRYLTLRKWLHKDPEIKLQQIPRRKQNFLSHCQAGRAERMSQILEKLEHYQQIPSLEMLEDMLKEIINNEQPKRRKQIFRLQAKRKLLNFTGFDSSLLDFFQCTSKGHRDSKVMAEKSLKRAANIVLRILQLFKVDLKLLCEVNPRETSFLLINERGILHYIRQMINDSNFSVDDIEAVASTSTSQPSLLRKAQHNKKHLLPPDLYTLTALKGFLYKFNSIRIEKKETFRSSVKLDSVKTSLEDKRIWQWEQKFLHFDENLKASITRRRASFFERLMAVFKWPCILSVHFPFGLHDWEEAEELEAEPEPEDDIPIPTAPRKVGRPYRTTNCKVRKMIAAKKSKIELTCQNNADLNTGIVQCDNNDNEQPKLKKKRGPKPKEPISLHAIRYRPSRAFTKKIVSRDEKTEDRLNNQEDGETNKPKANASNLKFNFAGAPLVSKDELIRLNKSGCKIRVIALGNLLSQNSEVEGNTNYDKNRFATENLQTQNSKPLNNAIYRCYPSENNVSFGNGQASTSKSTIIQQHTNKTIQVGQNYNNVGTFSTDDIKEEIFDVSNDPEIETYSALVPTSENKDEDSDDIFEEYSDESD